jgi:hypothetical protein
MNGRQAVKVICEAEASILTARRIIRGQHTPQELWAAVAVLRAGREVQRRLREQMRAERIGR